MSLNKVIESLLGDLYNEDEVESLFNLKSLILKNQIVEPELKPLFDLTKKSYVLKSDVKKLKKYTSYLKSRRITEEVADKYDLGYEPTGNQIVFPIYDKYHNCLGFGSRKIDQKIYRYPNHMIKPVYGIYELGRFLRYVWIVEGPFNLWSLSGWNKQGVALLGTGSDYQMNQLKDIDCKGFVFGLDPDEAGRKGIYKIGQFLSKYKKFDLQVALIPEGKDINDLTLDEFKQVEVIPFYQWKKWYENKILSSK